MIAFIKDFSLSLVIGTVINAASTWLKSDFLIRFLENNLITLLIALMAINTTTISVILTKLREISDKNNNSGFAGTVKAMRGSIVEQIGLIVAAVIVQVLKDSPSVLAIQPWLEFVIGSVVITIFIKALQVLWDTANSVFVMLPYQ